MNEKTELKILHEFLKIIDRPADAQRKFFRYAKTALFISVMLILFCLSDNIHSIPEPYGLLIIAFAAGTSFGLALWFLQAGTQSAVMLRHMSSESIEGRIKEISS